MIEEYRFISDTPWELKLMHKQISGEYDCIADHITLEDGTKVLSGSVVVTLKTDLPLNDILKVLSEIPDTEIIKRTIEKARDFDRTFDYSIEEARKIDVVRLGTLKLQKYLYGHADLPKRKRSRRMQ